MPRDDIPGAHIEEVEKAKQTHADLLISLAQAADLFHTPDGTGFADLIVNGHRETWPICSKGFKLWLKRRFFEAKKGAPSAESLRAALGVIEAKAHFDGAERTVHIRVAGLADRLYLDLADADWQVVEVDGSGWRIIDKPPVRFRRAAGMRPIPIPQTAGSIADLRRFVNVTAEADFVLLVAWLLAALRDCGPYPVLALVGEQGSAKSFLAMLLRMLIDPSVLVLRSPPREDRDLFIAATNGHVIAIDNVSSLPPWLSDALCRLATGGGFATRQLYTDQDEVLLDAQRPIALTGIEDFVIRGDLTDRTIVVRLDPISEDRRRPEKELLAAFEEARPRILGALLDTVSHGLRHLSTTRLDRLPRMADFAIWATACECALWPAGAFERAYAANRADANETVIEADSVALAVRSLMTGRASWTGTATALLAALAETAGETAVRTKTWPTTARALSGRLRRAAPNLRRVGISIVFGHRQARERRVEITAVSGGIFASFESSPSSGKRINGLDDDGRVTQNGTDAATVIRNPRTSAVDDANDANDAKIPS